MDGCKLKVYDESALDVSTVECVRKALQYCRGVGLDILAGNWKISRGAIGVSRNPLVGPDLVWSEGPLPFMDGEVDFVTSMESLPRIWDLDNALSEWARVLKPGGYLVASVPDNSTVRGKGAPQLAQTHVFTVGDLVGRLGRVAPDMEVAEIMRSSDGRLATVVAKKRFRKRLMVLYFGPRLSTTSLLGRGFEKLGHTVVFVGRGGDYEPAGNIAVLGDVLGRFNAAGLRPDLIVRHEEGPAVEGLESRGDIPTAYIDVHSNTSFQGHALESARYDFAFVSQKSFAGYFTEHGNKRTEWLPFGCDPDIHRLKTEWSGAMPLYDVGFVGSVDDGDYYRPRKVLLERLSKRFRVAVRSGIDFDEMAETFARCKMIFSRSALHGLHLRIFEAMSYGRLLLSEDCDGLRDLFTPGQHFALYEDDDLEGVAQYYLDHEDERNAIAARGHAEVLAHHTYAHRAAAILDKVFGAGRKKSD